MSETKIKPKLVDFTISEGRQSITAVKILKLGDFKLRMTVVSDAYKFQCSAVCEVWNTTELKWHEVYRLRHGVMSTPEGLIYYPGGTGRSAHYYQTDFETMLKMAEKILL